MLTWLHGLSIWAADSSASHLWLQSLFTMRISAPALQLALASQISGTNFLNHDQLLAGVEDRNWFERNVPLLDIPVQQIQDVYYYRWQTYKEHLVYTGAQYWLHVQASSCTRSATVRRTEAWWPPLAII